jgi:CubicO group peptidase (beta-lactamase class C family)
MLWLGHHDYVHGPSLERTPAKISLSQAFPPALIAAEREQRAFDAASTMGACSVIVLEDGRLVAEWGRTDDKISAHSVRKSLISALYGIAAARGLIDMNVTLGELGIDDRNPPLTAIEKTARVTDLLTSRSGIYHPSIRDDNGPYPAPGTHRPDEAFVYNNWSFNAAGSLFERATGMTLGTAFDEWIAQPIGMQDFAPDDVRYEHGDESVFPAYRFWMSARDLARFGQLYLDAGAWRDRMVIPRSWVEATFIKHTDNPGGASYGYMWWIMPDGSYLATGTGGQKIRIFPVTRRVIVTRVDTGSGLARGIWSAFGPRVTNRDTLHILDLLFEKNDVSATPASLD